MTHLVFDTNILIDYLSGQIEALSIIDGCENMTRAWINSTFKVLPIDEETADLSIEVRKQTKKKLPDTVIHATAMLNGWPIVTRNPRDFTPLAQVPAGYNNVDVIVPYSLP